MGTALKLDVELGEVIARTGASIVEGGNDKVKFSLVSSWLSRQSRPAE